MPHEPHDVFLPPADPNQRIWRYMDLPRFLYLMRSSELFFCRVDALEDEFEGALPEPNIQERHAMFDPLRFGGKTLEKAAPLLGVSLSEIEAATMSRQIADYIESRVAIESFVRRRFTCVNCWHMNDIESSAMWKVYATASESVAVVSSYARLVDSLRVAPERIFVGGVRYTRFETEPIPEGNDFQRFVTKRKSFEHERELRALISEEPDGDLFGSAALSSDPECAGRSIHADFGGLVEYVVISPRAQQWFTSLVTDLVAHFGYTFDVRQSSLLTPAQY